MLRKSWDQFSLAVMEAAWSISDDHERHRSDGEGDDWDPDAIISDDESDDD
jgi:hypothetical protein